MEVSFVFPGEPIPAARPRVTSRGTYTPAVYRNYKSDLARILRSTFPKLVALVPPVSIPSARRKWLKDNLYRLELLVFASTRRGDITNYLKGVEDALQDSGLIANDSQIVSVWADKLIDKDNPRIELKLKKLDEFIRKSSL